MQSVNSLLRVFCMIAFTAIMACSISDPETDEFFDEFEQSQKEAAFQHKAREAFKASVTDVTGMTIDAVEAALASTLSTAPQFSALVDTTIKVNATETHDSGGTVTMTGSITERKAYDTEDVTIYIGLTVTYADLKVTVKKADGKNQPAVISGTQKIIGSMIKTPTAGEPAIVVSYDIKGSFTVDAREQLFEIYLEYDGGDTMNFTGTAGEELFNESLPAD